MKNLKLDITDFFIGKSPNISDSVRALPDRPPSSPHSLQGWRRRDMTDPIVAKIEANPKYHELRRKRSIRSDWLLTIIMMVVYYGYIALIAFNKPFLAQPLGSMASPRSAFPSVWA
jgi:hypothetical protein